MTKKASKILLENATSKLRDMGVSEGIIHKLENDIRKTVKSSSPRKPQRVDQKLPKGFTGSSGTLI